MIYEEKLYWFNKPSSMVVEIIVLNPLHFGLSKGDDPENQPEK